MGNKNSSSSSSSNSSKVHGQTANKVIASTEPPQHHVPRQGKVPSTTNGTKSTALRGEEYIGGVVHSDQQQWKAPVIDNDDTFTNFIQRTKYKLRTITMSKSNIDRVQSNTAPAPPDHEANCGSTNNNSNENQKDQFSEFIKLAKKKMTTTSSIGKNGSFRRG